MRKQIALFDFDQTITKEHTFSMFGLAQYPDTEMPHEEHADIGKKNAVHNMKEGIKSFLRHNDTHLSAIVTYHNNPSFIVGFISRTLDRELIIQETVMSNTEPTIAIAICSVEGTDVPFLISYIPAGGHEFRKTLEQLNGKNEQINHVCSILMQKQHMTEQTVVTYYDDTPKNIEQAQHLTGITAHLVDAANQTFTVKIPKEHKEQLSNTHTDTDTAAKKPSVLPPLIETDARVQQLRHKLKQYIDRIDGYIQADGESKGFAHGFWFFASSRALNRKANYHLAKTLYDTLATCTTQEQIAALFQHTDQAREQYIAQKLINNPNYIARGNNSAELNSIIEFAQTYCYRDTPTTISSTKKSL